MANQKPKVLVVDDEVGVVEVLKALLRREGYTVKTTCSGEEALEALQNKKYDLMISDIRMEPMDGLALLEKARQLQPHIAVIMMTAYAAVDSAVEAMKQGAFDYVCKPFKVEEMLVIVERALSYERVMKENKTLKDSFRTQYHFDNMIGEHDSMQELYRTIEKVGDTESTILIRGESGTGKELVARALHNNSKRAARPFVAINCAAIPETLLGSELFGYAKGSFTGANHAKKGLFETANGGTLFMDEIGSIPMNMQLSLLRALQEQEIRPIGSNKSIPINVRIIAATNENLENLIANKTFREDLYYRLSVIPVLLPPLRKRTSDIPLLAEHFLQKIGERENRSFTLDPDALNALVAYSWPGNVREVENVIFRSVALCEDGKITLDELPEEIRRKAAPATPETMVPPPSEFTDLPDELSLKAFIKEQERNYLRHVLERHNGDKEAAAAALGISLATFYRKHGE